MQASTGAVVVEKTRRSPPPALNAPAAEQQPQPQPQEQVQQPEMQQPKVREQHQLAHEEQEQEQEGQQQQQPPHQGQARILSASAGGSRDADAGGPAGAPCGGGCSQAGSPAVQQPGSCGDAPACSPWRWRSLPASCLASPARLGFPATLFEDLTGRPFKAPADVLKGWDEQGRAYSLCMQLDAGANATYLKGPEFAAWASNNNAQPGDLLAVKESRGRVLLRHVRAAEAGSLLGAEQGEARAGGKWYGTSSWRWQGQRQGQLMKMRQQGQPLPPAGEFSCSDAEMTQNARQLRLAAGSRQAGAQPAGKGEGAAVGGLGLTPCIDITPSIAAAFSAELAPEQRPKGTRPPRSAKGCTWTVEGKLTRHDTFYVGGLDMQQAAVAADIVLTWRHYSGEPVDFPDDLNFPEAGYAEDRQLKEKLRQINDKESLKLFLQAVVKQHGSAPGNTRVLKQHMQAPVVGRVRSRRLQHQHQRGGSARHGSPAGEDVLAAAVKPALVGQHASLAAGDDLDRLWALRRFFGHCASLLPNLLSLPFDLSSADMDLLAAVLTVQVGKTVLRNVKDGRDEWQRVADLLTAASGTPVSRHQVQSFFPPIVPGGPAAPDFVALHAAGLYTAAWPLPLRPAAVNSAQRVQHSLQHSADRFSVGTRLLHHWKYDDAWYPGEVVAVDDRGCVDILYDDGELHRGWDPSSEAFLFDKGEDPDRHQPTTSTAEGGRKRKLPEPSDAGAGVKAGGQGLDGEDECAQCPQRRRTSFSAATAGVAGEAVAGHTFGSPSTSCQAGAKHGTGGASWQQAGATGAALPGDEHPSMPSTRAEGAAGAHQGRQQQAEQQPQACPLWRGTQAAANVHQGPSSLPTAQACARPVSDAPAPEAGSGSSVDAVLVARRLEAAERKKQQALQTLAEVDPANPGPAGLQVLKYLALANIGGELLMCAVAGWSTYTLEQQQEVFEALVLSAGDWHQLEGKLGLVLP